MLSKLATAGAFGTHDKPARSSEQICMTVDAAWTRRSSGRENSPSCPTMVAGHALIPLPQVNAPRWLVVRDELSRPIEALTLAPMADLRAALLEEREARAQEGWQAEEIAPSVAFFFCTRDGARRCVRIEAFAPGTAPL